MLLPRWRELMESTRRSAHVRGKHHQSIYTIKSERDTGCEVFLRF